MKTAFKKEKVELEKRIIEVSKDDELRVSSNRASTYRQGSFKDQLPKPGFYCFIMKTFLKFSVNSNYFICPREMV